MDETRQFKTATRQTKKQMDSDLWTTETPDGLFVNLFDDFKYYKNDLEKKMTLLNVNIKCEPYAFEYIRLAKHQYDDGKTIDAIRLFNRALCFANFDTEVMGLAYEGRATCFDRLQLYDQSLNDTQIAKALFKTPILVEKLNETYKAIKRKVDKKCREKTLTPELSWEAHKNDVAVANVLAFARGGYRGYSIVANRKLEAGQLLYFGPELIKSAKLAPSQMVSMCSYCGRSYGNTRPCRKCSVSMTCSVVCKAAHATECCLLSNAVTDRDTFFKTRVLNVKRSLDFALKLFDKVDDLMRFFEDAVNIDDDEMPSFDHNPRQQYRAFLKLYKGPSSKFEMEFLEMYYCILAFKSISNKFQALRHTRFLQHLIGYHMSVLDTAQSLSLYANYLDHSCAPNTTVIVANGKVCFYSIRPIWAGERLTIAFNYWDKVLDDEVRKEKLGQFGVDCLCERCFPEKSKKPDGPKILADDQYAQICHFFRYQMNLAESKALEPLFDNLLNTYGYEWTRELQGIQEMYQHVLQNAASTMHLYTVQSMMTLIREAQKVL